MSTKYQNAISEIKINNEVKERLKINMEQVYRKDFERRGRVFRIKKRLTTILTTLTALAALLCGGGIVYAKLGGTINGKPVLEWFGQIIPYSDSYSDYTEPVNNQFIENDSMKFTLQNVLSDDGFIILNFDLKFKEEFENKIKKEIEITDSEFLVSGISFNDIYKYDDIYKREVWENLYTKKSKIIIDKEEFNRTNLSSNSIKYSKETGTYKISQIYFLTEDELKGKRDFILTLNNPVIAMPKGSFKVIDGKFDIQISKSKSINNSEFINSDNATIKYGDNFEQKIEKVSLTPLYDIIKITSITLANKYEGNTGGPPAFRVYNKDKKIDPLNISITKTIYEDGKSVLLREDFDDPHYFDPLRSQVIDGTSVLDYDHDIIEVKERVDINYIILDKIEETSNLKIEVYLASTSYETDDIIYDIDYVMDDIDDMIDDALKSTTLLCNYYLDLKNKTIKTEKKNEKTTKEIVYDLYFSELYDHKINQFDKQLLNYYYRDEKIEIQELSEDDLKILDITLGINKSDVKQILGNNYKTEYQDIEYMVYKDLGIKIGIDKDKKKKIYVNTTNILAMRNLRTNSTIKDVVNAFNEKNILYFNKEQGYDKEFGITSIIVVGYEGTDVFGYSEKPKIIFSFNNNILTDIIITKSSQ